MSEGKTPHFLLSGFGHVHSETHPDPDSFILKFVHTELQNTFVTFDIEASDIKFVTNMAKGRIVDVISRNFTANDETGLILVEIENTGEIDGDFLVTLAHCHDDRIPSTKKCSLSPGHLKNVSFTFQAFVRESSSVNCRGKYSIIII